MSEEKFEPLDPGPPLSPETRTAQALGHVDPITRSLVPAIYPSTTYERDADGGYSSGRGYTRPHNPTYDEPEELLAELEKGVDCLLFASGMAAATTVFQSLFPGDHVVVPRVMYWALRSWLVDFAMSWGLDVEFVDNSDLTELAAAMRPGKTRLVWLETPANPTWDVTDIRGAVDIAKSVGARVVVDSTVATPVLTRALELGADLVMHSATKYLNGHSDVLAGAIVTAQEDSFWQRVKACRRDGGAVLGPFEAWLLLRGMRTLFVRVERTCANALAVAKHFDGHDKLSVLYPGLDSHPGNAIARTQMNGGFGGMLSVRHRDGEAAAMETAARVKLFKRGTSLGGVESLIEHRASIEGPSTPVPRDLLRLSIGLESVDDLIADLTQALDHDVGANSSANATTTQPQRPRLSGDPVAAIKQLLATKIHTLVADRGCELELAQYKAGSVVLRISGSPGGPLPIRTSIENLLRHYVPEVREVAFTAEELSSDEKLPLQARVNHVLEEQINPAVRAHGGSIRLISVDEGCATVQFEGRCQGCAMANVTLRQGVEVMIIERVPEIISVADATDHTSGTNPYFKTKKGGK